jgi:PASTA domain
VSPGRKSGRTDCTTKEAKVNGILSGQQRHGTRSWLGAAALAAGVVLVIAPQAAARALGVEPTGLRAQAPANDAFANAESLLGRGGLVSGSTVEATREPFEPGHGGYSAGASVWYQWTAPNHAQVQISTCDSSFDTILVVYTGTLGGLMEVGESDNNCGRGGSLLAFVASAGTTYRIAVDGAHGEQGEFALQWEHGPANDFFADATELVGQGGSVEGDNVLAGSEPGEPAHGGPGTRSVWYRWTAATTGPVVFETCSAAIDTLLAGYRGSSVSALTRIDSNDDFCAETGSLIGFDAVGGETYRIAVDGYNSETGEFLLRWLRAPYPPRNLARPEVLNPFPLDGTVLNGFEGVWEGAPTSFTFTWQSCDANLTSCQDVAQGRTLRVTAADIGRRFRFVVTAVNQSPYPATAFSDPTAAVRGAPPQNLALPTLSGLAHAGSDLVADPGTWIGTPPIAFQYQWQRCDSGGIGCVDIAGQTGAVIPLDDGVVGARVRVIVHAQNPYGGSAASAITTEVVAARARVAARRCVVPKLRRKTLAAARTALRRSGCSSGRIRRVYSRSIRRGRVVAQTPRAGARRAHGFKVRLDLSKGRR